MNVTIRIPDDFASRLGPDDLGRKALEALALEEYRAGRLGGDELQRLLGLETGSDLDAVLAAHDVQPRPTPANIVARFRAFRDGKTLDGLAPAALIREGRR